MFNFGFAVEVVESSPGRLGYARRPGLRSTTSTAKPKLLRISQLNWIMRQIRTIEILLIEVIIYLALWLINDYVAMYLSMIFGSICFFILLFTGIAELLERSKVSRKYFWIMAASALAPVIAAALFFLLLGGEMTWNKL
jgi:hypothetical protein